MKAQGEESTVEGVCRLLRRSNLLPAQEVEALEKRWRLEAGDRSGLAEFATWLVAGRYVTEYQMTKLQHGQVDHFFLDEYKLLDKIARERLARVYKATNRIGQVVALKVLPPSQARDPQAVARFQREARLGKQLDHHNVVRLLSNGESGGLHYLVMEYLEGETLQDVLARRGRLPVAEAVDIVVQALAGLEHLLAHGLVHRNISLPCLLLLPSGPIRSRQGPSLPPVKLLDLSLCRALDEVISSPEGNNRIRRSEEELLLATAYLAPELARDPHTGDIRGDIFSLGCVLYHALSGASPFPSTGSGRQVSRDFSRPIPPLCEGNPEVPEELSVVVSRMMKLDPAERFSTPLEASNALEESLTRKSPVTVEMEPVTWPSPPPPPPPPPEPNEDEEFSAPSFEAESSDRPFLMDPALSFTDEEPTREDSARVAITPARRAKRRLVVEPRDWVLLLLGAGGLLFVQGIAWVLARLFGAR